MPCDASYMNPTYLEIELSKVCSLLDELKTKKLDKRNWEGYHPKVYSKHLSLKCGNDLVSLLCKSLQKVDVTQYSLEMQIWWRDHRIADKKRIEKEQNDIKEKKEKEKALSKLTDYEKELLGLK